MLRLPKAWLYVTPSLFPTMATAPATPAATMAAPSSVSLSIRVKLTGERTLGKQRLQPDRTPHKETE